MKITDVEAIIVKQDSIALIGDGSQDTVVIRVLTDTGLTGLGEVDSSPYVVKAIIDAPASHVVCRGLRDAVLGMDPLDIDAVWKRMYELSYYYGRRGAAIHAMSGVDMALWDIKGKALRVPVHQLLGGARRKEVPAYCSVLMPGTKGEIKALVDRNKPKGFRGFKFGWGALGRDPKKDVQLMRWARELVGPDLALAIDIGMLWPDARHGLRICRQVEDLGLAWLEEPFTPDALDEYRRLADATAIPISAGEELGPLQEFEDLFERGHVKVVQPDVSRCGGLTVARQVAELARRRGAPLLPHSFKTGILLAASLHLVATLKEAPFMEYCAQETPLSLKLMKNHFRPDSRGMVQIPQGPGLGIEVDGKVLERYRVKR